MRNPRLANFVSVLGAIAAVCLAELICHLLTGWWLLTGAPEILIWAGAFGYVAGGYLGWCDLAVIWTVHAWRNADYQRALNRIGAVPQGEGRVPLKAFLLSSANQADQAYELVAHAKLPRTDVEDPSYDLDFAAGRAALAQRDLGKAQIHFDQLNSHFPNSALACYALGDLLLWRADQPEWANQLLAKALADNGRYSLPHWKRLGLEAELWSSYAWSLAQLGKAAEIQNCLHHALELAGTNKPVRAAVHLRLGLALRVLNHVTTSRQHLHAARDIDPQGWAGNQAERELRN